MPRRRHKGKKPNVNEIAYRVVRQATGEAAPEPEDTTGKGKDPEAVKRGREGGKKGGRARADSLTPEQRREIARKAAKSRWGRNHP